MWKLRYKLLSPIRLLLPFSSALFATPFFVPELMNYYMLPIFFFFGSYFLFLNFPSIAENLHARPVYLEDLVVARGGTLDHTFQRWYSAIMNFVLSLLFAAFADYVIIKGVRELPATEMLAIIGGNISLYMKTQDTIGKTLVGFIHILKTNEEDRQSGRSNSVVSTEIELREQPDSGHPTAIHGVIDENVSRLQI